MVGHILLYIRIYKDMASPRAPEEKEESYRKEAFIITLGVVEGFLNNAPKSRLGIALSVAMRFAALAATASLFSRLSIADEKKGRCKQQELFFFHGAPSAPPAPPVNDAPVSYLTHFSASV